MAVSTFQVKKMAEKIRKWHKKNLSQKCVNQEDLWNLLSKDIFEENIYYPTPIIPLKQSFFFSSFEFVLKNIRRPKNKYGYNFPFQVLPFNQPQNIPIGSTLIEYGSMKLKIEQVFIFLDDANFPKKLHIWPDFEQQKVRFKKYSIKNHHIYRNGRTSAFKRLHGYLLKNFATEKKAFAFA